jgi:hypothetical protein
MLMKRGILLICCLSSSSARFRLSTNQIANAHHRWPIRPEVQCSHVKSIKRSVRKLLTNAPESPSLSFFIPLALLAGASDIPSKCKQFQTNLKDFVFATIVLLLF